MVVRISCIAISLTLTGCATETPPTSIVEADTGQRIVTVNARDIPRIETSTNAQGETVICRTDDETGSRIRKNRFCGTESEWASYEDLNDHFVREWTVDRGSGHGPW